MRVPSSIGWPLLWLALVASACSKPSTGETPMVGEPKLHSEPRDPAPLGIYPFGRWRLVDPQRLSKVVLWVSHISIRHRESERDTVNFDSLWYADTPPPERSRREALELARQVAAEAQRAPSRFADLARQLSEDTTSAAGGGSLGGIVALEWIRWPRLLDALATLRPGEVSKVVETPYGFHVLQRREPPRAQRVTGAHIVIGYDQAPWLGAYLARRPVPRRSRAEAWALAQQVYSKLSSEPEQFAAFVERYSDHEDAAQGGDLGSWSTEEPSPIPRVLEVLVELDVGAIAPPLDTPFGVQILRRDAERPRRSYGLKMIEMRFDISGEGAAVSSGEAARRELAQVARLLRAEPARFEEFQAKYCCPGIEAWREGRGSPIAERQLDQLRPGQMTPEPVLLNPNRYGLFQRVAPDLEPMVRPELDLPEPDKPDLEYFFALTGQLRELSRFRERALRMLQLEGELAQRFEALHAPDVLRAPADSAETALASFHEFQHTLSALLGSERAARYWSWLGQQVETELLSPARRSSD